MSSSNIAQRFASKIAGVVYFAEIPASASVKGRPKNVPHPRTRMGVEGMLLPFTNSELTLGNTRLIGHNQRRVVGDCIPRSSNPHKE